jgi:hypothetical protein
MCRASQSAAYPRVSDRHVTPGRLPHITLAIVKTEPKATHCQGCYVAFKFRKTAAYAAHAGIVERTTIEVG